LTAGKPAGLLQAMALGNVIGGQRAFLSLAIIYIGIGAVGKMAGLPIRFNIYGAVVNVPLALVLAGFVWWRAVRIIFVPGSGRPAARFWADMKRFFTVERALFALPAIVLFPIVLSVYSSWKQLIPRVAVYDWDPVLAQIDRAIHGDDVWRLLHPVLGTPTITLGLYAIYVSWFFAISLIGTWQMVVKGPAREQFLVSSVLCWGVVGTVGAMAFASVGPVFYGRLLGDPDPFAELAAYIRLVPDAAHPQDLLWQAYAENRLPEFGKGVSAMPSLHVAIATLNALVAWRHARWFGATLGAYAALVALASVHLGWHYAIDAYAGAAAAILIWRGVGLALRSIPKPAVRAPAE
jgi:hypothetical protein